MVRIGNVYYAQEKYDEAIDIYQNSLAEHNNPQVREKIHKIEKLRKEKERNAYLNPELAEEEREKGNEAFKKGMSTEHKKNSCQCKLFPQT